MLLFAAPALLLSVIAAAAAVSASAGVLWLFVFGDNPWPPVASTFLGAVFLLGSAGLWLSLLAIAFVVGKRQESRASLDIRHVALSIGATVVLLGLIVVRLTLPNILGGNSDSLVCADLCQAEGFAASGTPPHNSGDRTCSCYDGQGREARRIPLPP